MRVNLRGLLIYIAFVGLFLGQARLNPITGCLCLALEMACLGFFVPSRLSLWLTCGYVVGLVIGVSTAGVYSGMSRIGPPGSLTLTELQAYYQDQVARDKILISYGIQIGAMVGGTLGLIVGQLRASKRRQPEPTE